MRATRLCRRLYKLHLTWSSICPATWFGYACSVIETAILVEREQGESGLIHHTQSRIVCQSLETLGVTYVTYVTSYFVQGGVNGQDMILNSECFE